MPYTVKITKVETGETREYTVGLYDWDEESRYWWTDGNNGCDCNRELLFHKGDKSFDPETAECSEGRYTVELPTGEVV